MASGRRDATMRGSAFSMDAIGRACADFLYRHRRLGKRAQVLSADIARIERTGYAHPR
jgi:hypothetical protein